jgi:hypothetical protein
MMQPDYVRPLHGLRLHAVDERATTESLYPAWLWLKGQQQCG